MSSTSVSASRIDSKPYPSLSISKKDPKISLKDGRSWKDIGKSVSKKFLIGSLVLIGLLVVAAFIAGIVSQTAPGAFGILGAALTTALSWVLLNGVYLLVAGVLAISFCAAIAITILTKKYFENKSERVSASGSPK